MGKFGRMSKKVRQTVKDFQNNPRQVYFRLLKQLLEKHHGYGIRKHEVVDFLVKNVEDIDYKKEE